jgi:phospholipid/cholesterol/gamma-HCH transport system substrate-binding protein
VAIFNRKPRDPRDPGISPFRAGLITVSLLAVLSFFGFTKLNPFANPYELKAVFANANNVKTKSPVRIAGVEVGKVTKVEPLKDGAGAAEVTMQLKDEALPIHKDAAVKVRSRIFLEGNFFVDIRPGSPSAPTLDSGAVVPVTQTAAPVQFGQLLSALQEDTRSDLQTFLKEYSHGLEGKGARGFNEAIKYWRSAYKNGSLANDASLGSDPAKDLQRVLKGQQRTFAALNADEGALKGLVTNFNTTAGAFASQDVALEASIPALRDTLRVAQPALASLNNALPELRAFSRDALPGVQSSNATLRESLPFIRQARLLVRKKELRGTAALLRRYIPSFVSLNNQSVDISVQGRALSACTNDVLVPLLGLGVPDPDFPQNTNQKVREQNQRSFPTLAGESRLTEGNGNQFFHTGAVAPGTRVRPGPPTDGGSTPPPHRPDLPCEVQDLPNLHAPGGPTTSFPGSAATVASAKGLPSKARSDAFSRAFGKAVPKGLKKASQVEAKKIKRQKAKRAKRKSAKRRKARARKVSR